MFKICLLFLQPTLEKQCLQAAFGRNAQDGWEVTWMSRGRVVRLVTGLNQCVCV